MKSTTVRRRRMRYTRTVALADGGSRFADVDVSMKDTEVVPGRPAFATSPPISTVGSTLLRIGAGWDGDWHPSPKRWFVVTLSGEMEVTTTDGAVRRFGPGSLWLVDDTTGRGHNTRVLTDWTGFGVDLAEQLPVPRCSPSMLLTRIVRMKPFLAKRELANVD
jgi:hypothetical protein